MKKKIYIHPETCVISIPSSQILAGSGGTTVEPKDDVTTDAQYSKQHTDSELWDE